MRLLASVDLVEARYPTTADTLTLVSAAMSDVSVAMLDRLASECDRQRHLTDMHRLAVEATLDLALYNLRSDLA